MAPVAGASPVVVRAARPVPAPTLPDRVGGFAASAGVRRKMQRQPRRDTNCELALRRELHRRGLRYRVDVALPELGRRRRVDVVFPRRRVAVLVDGCFWHGCPTHGTRPRANAGWWAEKITRNRRRDADTSAVLLGAGWVVLRVWEHEDVTAAADAVAQAVRHAPPAGRPGAGCHPDGG